MLSKRTEHLRETLLRLSHHGLDIPSYARRASDVLRKEVPFDGCCWLTLDPATLLPTSHLALNSVRPEDVPELARNEYAEEDVNKLAQLARTKPPAAVLSQATSGEPHLSPRYCRILKPNGFHGELRAALVDGTGCWGGLALYRRPSREDFCSEEVELMGAMSGTLAEGLRRALLMGAAVTGGDEDAPGLLVLDRKGGVEAMTPPARRWLDELLVNSSAEGGLPNVVHAVAYRAQLAAKGSDGGTESSAQARVPSASGRWLVLHGSRLGPLDDGRTAVILEPARSPQIAPLIAKAHGLTDREAEVAGLVMRGFSNREIARELGISPYTVQDHIKALFSKVGVQSRGELVAQVFFRHYVPRLERGTPIGASGWFAET